MPQHPLTSDEGLKDAARSTLRELLTIAKRYRLRRRRLDTLYLFDNRKRKKGRTLQVGEKAVVVWDDSPEQELILKRREWLEELTVQINDLKAIAADNVGGMDPETAIELAKQIRSLHALRSNEAEAIQVLLQQMGRELIAQEQTLTKVVAEGAKLAQLAIINREKLEAMAAERSGGITSKSTAELETLAKEFQAKIANGELFVIQEQPDVEKSGED